MAPQQRGLSVTISLMNTVIVLQGGLRNLSSLAVLANAA